ncbi:hypothetical protein EDD90_3314 [Streptomyces sp. Ag109_O5-1]|uniref:hypothetical protein n=1 Tax=Streptomyces sp. Ag109_O5-1 TaxID=1938851 RepID=UPI000F4E2C3E|nr:hypothetical protein [Streptomyces sp. Ag109_O5-1]RPE40278.1 hypothetical protein EDD90_3314 [Streptomyces sp. Ag109_O5-1]
MPYITWNGPAPTTAALASVNTGTTIKTMLQLATPATRMIQLLEWGWSSDDPPGADGVIELLQTDVAATVAAHVASGVVNLDPNGTASLLTLGTSATGYTASAEGTITATRPFDAISLSSVSGESSLSYVRQWMPDARPIIPVSKFLRVRATTPTTGIDMRCYIVFNEVG